MILFLKREKKVVVPELICKLLRKIIYYKNGKSERIKNLVKYSAAVNVFKASIL